MQVNSVFIHQKRSLNTAVLRKNLNFVLNCKFSRLSLVKIYKGLIKGQNLNSIFATVKFRK